MQVIHFWHKDKSMKAMTVCHLQEKSPAQQSVDTSISSNTTLINDQGNNTTTTTTTPAVERRLSLSGLDTLLNELGRLPQQSYC